ncbi:MAG: MarR family transcriptional regulator [bacterium]|nr:MarR family transcriptional regulator [bacterium]
MNSYDTINNTLVKLFNEILDLEEVALITEEYQDITSNDMHIIEAIGLGEGSNMSTIAKRLNITVGSLTTSMNSLVKKAYAIRTRSDEDRRVVYIKLTDKGVKAYKHHEEFHNRMTEAAIRSLDEEQLPVLIKTLTGLSSFFQELKEKEKHT